MKLRLISIVAVTGVLGGCGGLAFLNLAAVPATAAVGAGTALMGVAPGAGVTVVAANATLSDSVERYGNPEVGAFPVVVTGDLRAYAQATTGPLGNIDGIVNGVPTVGHYENYNEVIIGRVNRNLSDDTEELDLRLANSGVTCSGKLFPPNDGWPTEWPIATRNCLNRIARGTLTCSDGRELVLDWRATQCRIAYGEGFDRDGGTIRFEVLDSAETAASKAQLLTAQLSPYTPLPLVR
jgi:hypothetical protein